MRNVLAFVLTLVCIFARPTCTYIATAAEAEVDDDLDQLAYDYQHHGMGWGSVASLCETGLWQSPVDLSGGTFAPSSSVEF